MEFRFTGSTEIHTRLTARLNEALTAFAADPELHCLTLYSHNNGRVQFYRSISTDRSLATPFTSVEAKFNRASFDSLNSMRITLQGAVEVERTGHGGGDPLIDHQELTRFVQVLHAKWLRER